jgi:hypothetical protein
VRTPMEPGCLCLGQKAVTWSCTLSLAVPGMMDGSGQLGPLQGNQHGQGWSIKIEACAPLTASAMMTKQPTTDSLLQPEHPAAYSLPPTGLPPSPREGRRTAGVRLSWLPVESWSFSGHLDSLIFLSPDAPHPQPLGAGL